MIEFRTRTAFCLDLDGTITREEILPRLARELDLFDEIRLLTEATLKGVLTFQKSFQLRCRLLSAIPVSRVQAIVETVQLDPEIEAFMRRNTDRAFIVTGNLDVWIAPLVERLGCRAFCSEAEVSGDQLLGVKTVLDKGDAVRQVRRDFQRVIVVGDGMNDAPMFEEADVGISFGGVHAPVSALLDLSSFVVTDGKALCRLFDTL